MDRTSLIESVAKAAGTTAAETKVIVDIMVDTMLRTFSSGESVDLGDDFGRFEVRQREAERYKNGGNQIQLPKAKNIVVFKGSGSFKKAINGELKKFKIVK